MRPLTPTVEQHFNAGVTTLATCWKIIRKDSFTLGFTDCDKALIIDNNLYDSIAGFTPTNVESTSNLSVDNLNLSGQLFPSKITDTDLLSSKYDFAEIEIFLVNYLAPEKGKLQQKRGILGEVTISKNLFYAEVRGLAQFLSQTMCEAYMPHCRANLGDSRCRFNVKKEGFTVEASLTEVIDAQVFVAASLNQPNGWFTWGYITWLSGKNQGLQMEVKEYSKGKVTLSLPMIFKINVGDRFSIVAGCDKSSKTCIEKFGNIINFRGEPDLPGTDKLLTTAGTMRR